jgi:benzoyl-CoA reductase/2-hydroxyglutaryl-CoA dehydratase subunit BcrC/BadD/HgdB
LLQAPLGTDATPRIFEHWAREAGADLFLFERTADTRLDLPIDWWDAMLDRWDDLLQPERLDLMTAELRTVIARIEATTDRRFDADKFAQIMDLVNEQEDYYRKTRDLIATAHPAPVSITDTMPATMVPQWHRGTEWARDAARDFYEEVKARHEAGEAACPGEKLRLMWVGRGLWSDMGFTQRWEESHGAVFVWSMYLALAADGYIRRTAPGQDPLRALAARFVTMGDELRMPTWAGEWHVKEAQTHAIDGAVALSDADPFVLRALRRAGVPVLSLDLDNYNQEGADEAAIDRQIVAFLEGPVSAYRTRR